MGSALERHSMRVRRLYSSDSWGLTAPSLYRKERCCALERRNRGRGCHEKPTKNVVQNDLIWRKIFLELLFARRRPKGCSFRGLRGDSAVANFATSHCSTVTSPARKTPGMGTKRNR